MTVSERIKYILENLISERNLPFKGNILAGIIRNEFPKEISKLINNSKLRLKGSAGAGNWADVPWLSILDERITKTTQDGVYPVLIFRADATGVYLSLMQGTTNPIKEFGSEQAEKQALKLKNRILSNTYEIKTWDTRKLDLRTTTSLGKSYEKSNIAAKYYALGSLPTDEVFRNDLTTILKVYDAIASEWSTYKDSSTIAIESGNDPMPKETIQILSHSTSLVDLLKPYKKNESQDLIYGV